MIVKCTGLIDDTVSVIIGGEAGQGVSRSGILLGKALMRAGFHCYGRIDYPSLIRGGHNFYQLRASAREVHCPSPRADILVALNKESVLLHIDDLNPEGGVIYDENVSFESGEVTRDDLTFYPIPFTNIVKEIGGPTIMRNTVALGSAAALIGLDMNLLKDIVSETFKGRDRIIEMNHEAIQRGWQKVIEFDYSFKCGVEAGERPERIWVTGNEAVALGAIQAGCKFFAAYPMTPASAALHYLIAHEEETGMVVLQPESEIAAICMTVGASFAGVRAMTATSGGGFALMIEGLSFSAMTETPIVTMLAQRPGPSTGLATYTAQADLFFAVFGGHGEFQRIVVAPGDMEECFHLTAEAFNLADRFQIPVIILTDKALIENHKTSATFDTSSYKIDRGKLVDSWESNEEYLRYKFTDDGVSPRAVLGTENAVVLVQSNEHTERGFVTSKPKATKEMMDKRFRKVPHIRDAVEQLEPVKVYGDEDPDVTLFGWGSTKGPVLEAIGMLSKKGVKTRFVQVRFMEPFPSGITQYLEGACVLFETNRSAGLGTLIKFNTGFEFQHVALKYDGRPFFADEIVDKVMEVWTC
ncbi:MAG: 2-oxoacid:acceptor oxidoreductase subunit alpha [Candidatus Bathyarchaeota archaeon]|nr:2-oxoacid:acceptor oxidoreductase subunit alpha [Candidatus Bathyarchaeota archaeon]